MKRAVILAAGGGRRLGQPKPLVAYGGGTLLSHTIGRVVEAGAEEVNIVIGARRRQVEQAAIDVVHGAIRWVVNRDWRSGQSTSLRAAMTDLDQRLDREDVVLVTLCDLPRVPAEHYRALFATVAGLRREVAATGCGSAAGAGETGAGTGDGPGVPVCFGASAWRELDGLDGDRGARDWLRRQPAGRVAELWCPEARIDVDWPSDVARLSMPERD